MTSLVESASEPILHKKSSIGRERLLLLSRSKLFLTGMVIVLFWVLSALFGKDLVPYGPNQINLLNTLSPPSLAHWFGTDQFGRDIFSRVIVGSRDILIVAPLATILGTVFGTFMGLVMGYMRGFVDDAIGRLIDAFLALPVLIIAMLVITALGNTVYTIIVTIGLSFGLIIGRVVRSAVLNERDLDYIAAANLRGESAFYIMFVEILPNVVQPIMVETTVRLGYAIFTVASLSFLGLGIQPPSPDWGLSISENYGMISGGYWWTVLFYALAIGSLVVSVNLVAEGIKGALDA